MVNTDKQRHYQPSNAIVFPRFAPPETGNGIETERLLGTAENGNLLVSRQKTLKDNFS